MALPRGYPPFWPHMLVTSAPSHSGPCWILQIGCSLRLVQHNRCKPHCCQDLPEADSPSPSSSPASSFSLWTAHPPPPPMRLDVGSYLVLFSTCLGGEVRLLWGLIRMWAVQVEKQDLNEAGTNAQSCVAATFLSPPPTHPCLGCPSVDRRGHPYLPQVVYACEQCCLGRWGWSFKGLCCMGWLCEC